MYQKIQCYEQHHNKTGNFLIITLGTICPTFNTNFQHSVPMQGIAYDNKLHEESRERFVVDRLLICVDCGSTNTKLFEKGIRCNECQSFLIYKKHYHLNFLQQIILTHNRRKI